MQPGTISASQLEQQYLRELESQRRHLTHMLVDVDRIEPRASDGCVGRLNRGCSMTKIKKQIEQLDLLIKEQINASPELSAKAQKLTAINGVGVRRLPCSWRKCRSWDSSIAVKLRRWLEWRHLIATVGKCAVNVPYYGGGRPVRHGLYMAALVAARHNPILRAFYLCRLCAAGKPPRLALTATMRKLLIVLTGSLKPDPTYV